MSVLSIGYSFSLEMVIKDLRKRLDSTPPDLPAWLYLSSDSVPAITPTLDYWLTTKKTTKRMLERHSHMSPDDPRADIVAFHPGGNKDRQKAFKDKRDAAYAQIRTVLQSLTPEQLRTWPIFSRNTPAAEMLAYVRNNMETLVEKFWNESRGGKVPLHEEAWYWTTKVFFPPRELLKRHPGFDEAWKRIRNNEEISESTQRKVGSIHSLCLKWVLNETFQLQKQIESEWKPNITLFVRIRALRFCLSSEMTIHISRTLNAPIRSVIRMRMATPITRSTCSTQSRTWTTSTSAMGLMHRTQCERTRTCSLPWPAGPSSRKSRLPSNRLTGISSLNLFVAASPMNC